jgi:hypothetical protein
MTSPARALLVCLPLAIALMIVSLVVQSLSSLGRTSQSLPAENSRTHQKLRVFPRAARKEKHSQADDCRRCDEEEE